MLVNEVISLAARPTGRTVDATDAVVRSLRDYLEPGRVSDAGAADTSVVAVKRDVASEDLRALLGDVVDGARIVLLVACTVKELPVGRLVDAVVGTGVQAVAAVPVEDRDCGVAILLERCSGQAPVWGYLAPEGELLPNDTLLHRVVAEYVIEGAARRGREVDDEASLADLRQRLADAETQVARLTRELVAVRRSRTYEVGKAFGEVRKAPVSGLLALPGKLRRAGKAERGR